MKVEGSVAPSKNYSVEQIPNNPKFALVRFYENVEKVEKNIDDTTYTSYTYDEYHLELPYYPSLEVDVGANINNLLTQAKYEEAEKNTIPNLKDQVKTLEEQKKQLEEQATDMQLALCDVYEQMLSVTSTAKE